MIAQRRRLVLVTLAYLVLSWGGQLILQTTPFELHRTITLDARLGAVINDLLWLAALLLLIVRQPTSRLPILILAWLAVQQLWLIGYADVNPRILVDLPQAVGGDLWAAVFVHLIVAYPSGRLSPGFERRLVLTTYAVAVGFRIVAMVIGPDPCYPMCDSPIRFFPSEQLYAVFEIVGIVAAFVLLLTAIAVLVRHWRVAGPAGRRVLAPMLVAAPIWCVSVFAGYFADAFLDEAARDATHSFNPIGLFIDNVLPAAIILGALQSTLARGNVAQLALELGRGVPVGGLRPILAKTLRDPSLELAFPAPDGSGLVDELGMPVGAPDPDRRTITRVEQDGELLAVLIDDPQAVAEDPSLVEAVGSVARLALANERLAAQVRAQLEEVRASRARIVEAADAERRRVERDLHDGAQQRLTALAVRLDVARETGSLSPELLAAATTELRSAIGEVRDLSRGLHPTILTEAGLGPAIEALAERTTTPVRVIAPSTRFPPAIEAAAYFVAAEGLTNVTRYSGASAAAVEVSADRGLLTVVVHDDGRGGADPARGSGLRGLADRVAALDGRLLVESPDGGGTILRAELPLGGVAIGGPDHVPVPPRQPAGSTPDAPALADGPRPADGPLPA